MFSTIDTLRSAKLPVTSERRAAESGAATPPGAKSVVVDSESTPNSVGTSLRRPAVPTTGEQLDRRRVASVRLFAGAAIALTLSTFLPWASILSVVSVHLSEAQVVYLLLFAAVYAGDAYLVHNERMTRPSMIGAWLVNVWMVINVVAIFDAFGNGGGIVSPGAGVYIASVGVMAAVAATVQLHRSRTPPMAAAPLGDSQLPTSERWMRYRRAASACSAFVATCLVLAACLAGTAQANASPSVLIAGQKLTAGQYLLSPNGQYKLIMQTDGNLVEYQGSTHLWATYKYGQGNYAVMQADGNLVVYNQSGQAVFDTHTWGFSGDYFSLQDDSNLVVYQGTHAVWDRHSGYDGSGMQPGWTLKAGEYLLSPNRQYKLIMQTDGNLVEYQGSSHLWATYKYGQGNYAVMQTDGNLVVCNQSGQWLWQSGTPGHAGAYLALHDDNDLIIYQGSTAIWDWRNGLLSQSAGLPTVTYTPGTQQVSSLYAYPWPNAPECTNGGACLNDTWGFSQGQCVSWVAYRIRQLNGPFANYPGPGWGSAYNWGAHARALGMTVDNTPALGSVAWYSYGHVAYVEAVASATKVEISEMNFDNANGFRIEWISPGNHWPTAFIHLHDR